MYNIYQCDLCGNFGPARGPEHQVDAAAPRHDDAGHHRAERLQARRQHVRGGRRQSVRRLAVRDREVIHLIVQHEPKRRRASLRAPTVINKTCTMFKFVVSFE